MQEGQKYIYFASGDTVDAVDHIPQTELLKDRGMEILYFTDKADEFLSDILRSYKDKPFRSATDGDLDLPGEAEKQEQDEQQYKEAFAFIKEALGGQVSEVKASTRLKTHPVCLSSGEGVTFEMEKYFTAAQPELGLKAKRILEINVDHPAFLTFEKTRLTDPEKAKKVRPGLLQPGTADRRSAHRRSHRLHRPALLPVAVDHQKKNDRREAVILFPNDKKYGANSCKNS